MWQLWRWQRWWLLWRGKVVGVVVTWRRCWRSFVLASVLVMVLVALAGSVWLLSVELKLLLLALLSQLCCCFVCWCWRIQPRPSKPAPLHPFPQAAASNMKIATNPTPTNPPSKTHPPISQLSTPQHSSPASRKEKHFYQRVR